MKIFLFDNDCISNISKIQKKRAKNRFNGNFSNFLFLSVSSRNYFILEMNIECISYVMKNNVAHTDIVYRNKKLTMLYKIIF
jgi:hypothetical protein